MNQHENQILKVYIILKYLQILTHNKKSFWWVLTYKNSGETRNIFFKVFYYSPHKIAGNFCLQMKEIVFYPALNIASIQFEIGKGRRFSPVNRLLDSCRFTKRTGFHQGIFGEK